jgi:hypothetical protein
MAEIVVIENFTSGKLTVKGEPNPELRRFPIVLAVAPSAVDRLLDVRTMPDRLRVLRRLRAEGLLITRGGRLTHNVHGGPPPLPAEKSRAYIFACDDPSIVIAAADRLRREESADQPQPRRGRVLRILDVPGD